MKRLLAMLLVAAPAIAQSVAFTPRGVVVAHDGVIETFDPNTLKRTSKAVGVEYAGAIVSDDVNVAVLDPLHNRVQILGGEAATTGETPTGGAYIDHELYILERDSRTITHRGVSLKTGANPLLCAAEGKLYVYSTLDGIFQEITTEPFAVARQMTLPPFATSFVTDAHLAYFTYPSEKLIRTVDVEQMAELGKSRVGRAPIDVALGNHATLLSARVLAIADPTEKIIWIAEGNQTAMLAFARGFLRGLIGIGVRSALNRAGGYGRDTSQFESGVDRVFVRSGRIVAYDSATGTLYKVTKEIRVLATGVAPRAFALGNDVVYIWHNGTLVAEKASE
jgi:hypothetical protein